MLAGRFAHQRATPLLRLPPELLHEILSALYPTGAYAPAVFLFASTCKLALALAQPHIARLQRCHFAPLAGHRLVCLNDGPGTLAHCPAGFFTTAEACALGGAPDTPLYGLIRKAWPRITPDPPALLRPTDILWRPSAVSRMSAGDFVVFRQLCEPYYPRAAPWVLCNVSRREYVRADALCWGDPRRLLWSAVFACICCIPGPDTGNAMGVTGPPVRGRWTGDRIEVATLGNLEARSEDGTKWTDVTQDVVSLVSELQKARVHPWADLELPKEPGCMSVSRIVSVTA
ncbi:hypothetical protein TRAPUB_6952 [Trametes pubescens]|uniref:Uncharacterized protein n=1 Tax=Trametes pubescens TaxID=154538 RepID=A0A1M2V4J3_TRAPU|nr:hypothetical protein TRAPUB_6952 [Trametes pubescens]